MSDPLGNVLDQRYRFEARLGEGGFALVWAAVSRTGMPVAIKVLRAEHIFHQAEVKRFLDQGLTQNAVASVCRHVPPILDDGFTDDHLPYVVMPLLVGKTVDALARARGGRLGSLETALLLCQALFALRAAHTLGIVHRDIKPENLFLAGKQLYLLDWGAAVHPHLPRRTEPYCHPPFTPMYVSPEVVRWEEATPRSDLYSLALTAWELLTGQLPRSGPNLRAILQEATSPISGVRQVDPHVDPDLAAIIDKAASVDPAARYESAAAMLAALEPVVRRLAATSRRRTVRPAALAPGRH